MISIFKIKILQSSQLTWDRVKMTPDFQDQFSPYDKIGNNVKISN